MIQKFAFQLLKPIPYGHRQNLFTTAGVRRVVPLDNNNFRYLRFRAIGNLEDPSAGPNGNWDAFPYEHFEDERPNFGYKSFIGKRAHAEHNSAEGIAGSIGDLPDAFLNRFDYPAEMGKNPKWASLLGQSNDKVRQSILTMPNQKDGAIEVLMRIDAKLANDGSHMNPKARKTAERIVRMIDTGQPLACSMGTNIEYSVCSTCGNTAHFAHQYCSHLKDRKGSITVVSANDVRDLLDKGTLRPEWLKHVLVAKAEQDEVLKGFSRRAVAVRNFEINHVLSFFELSVVANPAFTRAIQLQRFARQQATARAGVWSPVQQSPWKPVAQIEWDKLSDQEIMRFTAEAQERGLISTACALR
jgi:hypothetical protein